MLLLEKIANSPIPSFLKPITINPIQATNHHNIQHLFFPKTQLIFQYMEYIRFALTHNSLIINYL